MKITYGLIQRELLVLTHATNLIYTKNEYTKNINTIKIHTIFTSPLVSSLSFITEAHCVIFIIYKYKDCYAMKVRDSVCE